MSSHSVALLQRDPRIAHSLLIQLSRASFPVRAVKSVGELPEQIRENGVEVVVLDLEAASISDVETLSHEFPRVRFMCNHRVADEEMWRTVLNAGAEDCFSSLDVQGIVHAVLRDASAQSAAA